MEHLFAVLSQYFFKKPKSLTHVAAILPASKLYYDFETSRFIYSYSCLKYTVCCPDLLRTIRFILTLSIEWMNEVQAIYFGILSDKLWKEFIDHEISLLFI